MKKKFLFLIMVVTMSGALLSGCGEKKSLRPSSSSLSSSDSASTGEEYPAETSPSEESLAASFGTVSYTDLRNDSEYLEKIKTFQAHFLNYSALCINYPVYRVSDGFSEQTKVNLIGYAVGDAGTEGVKGDHQAEKGMYISPMDVEKLSQLFFNSSIDQSKIKTIEKLGYESVYDETQPGEKALMDENGGIYVCVGDWGLSYPVSENVDIDIKEGVIYVSNLLSLHEEDCETGVDKKLYDIGIYHLTLNYDLSNPDKFWIKDYSIEYLETPAPKKSEFDVDMIAELIADYYNDTYEPAGTYVVFSNEAVDNGNTVDFIVRYQMSDKEEEDRIENGLMPVANVYTDTITVNKSDFSAYNENGEEIVLNFFM